MTEDEVVKFRHHSAVLHAIINTDLEFMLRRVCYIRTVIRKVQSQTIKTCDTFLNGCLNAISKMMSFRGVFYRHHLTILRILPGGCYKNMPHFDHFGFRSFAHYLCKCPG